MSDILLPREFPRRLRGAVQSSFTLQSQSIYSVSPYTGGSTPYGPQVQRFVAKMTAPQLKRELWRYASGFITSLRGASGPVRMWDYHRLHPAYNEAIKPSGETWDDDASWDDDELWEAGLLPPVVAIDEAAAAGVNSLILRSLPASINAVLTLGDLVEIRPGGIKALHGHLYEIIEQSNADADGKTRIYFEPGLRAPVISGDQVVLDFPQTVMKLASDQEGVINRIAPGNLGNFGLSLVEVLPDDVPPR